MRFSRFTGLYDRVWCFRPSAEERALEFGRLLRITPLAARLLACRDLTDLDKARSFLNPSLGCLHDPLLMRDMDRAVDRIARALESNERIAVYGDYDVDGMTATSLLVRFFRWLGVETTSYIPHRLNEGYGMSRKGIDHLRSIGIKLIVTVDNGISCHEEISYASSLGIDVVVTDHHQPSDTLPEAVAIVNPNRRDCPYPFKDLSGVGVAFKLAHALSKRLGKPVEESKEYLKSLIDLVALGTIADIVPLLEENRALAWFGLKVLAKTDKQGLQAMIQMLGIDGKPMHGETVGYMLGPRLNAAGRTGEAQGGLELLLTDDEARSWDLARFLDELNDYRRQVENEVFTEALEKIDDDSSLLDTPVLVISGAEWHQGIIGIVASRLVERFGRPAIVLSVENEIAKGSARSVNGFDIHRSLGECANCLSTYGGHKMAAGLSLPASKIDEFRSVLNEVVRRSCVPEDLAPKIVVDTQARIDELTLQAIEEIERMRPFGEGNPSPLVALSNCKLVEPPRILKEKHLRLRLVQNDATKQVRPLGAIGFNFAHRHDEVVRQGERFDIAGAPRINEWNGNKSVELNIVDIRASLPPVA